MIKYLSSLIFFFGIIQVNSALTTIKSDATDTITISWEADVNYGDLTIYQDGTAVHNASYTLGAVYEIMNLTPGTEYTIRIDAVDTNGVLSTVITQTVYTRPLAPVFETISDDNVATTSLTLEWTNPGTYQQLRLIVEKDNVKQNEYTVSPDDTSFEVTQLQAGSTYTFQLYVIINNTVESEKAVLTDNTKPLPPTEDSTTTDTDNEIIISWISNEDSTQESYSVMYMDNNGITQEYSACKEITKTSCTVQFDTSSYPPGSEVTLKVVSNQGTRQSDALTVIENLKPAMPLNAGVRSQTETTITIEWQKPAGQVTTFQVTLDPDEGTKGTVTAENNDMYSFTQSILTAGKMYKFSIVTQSGNSTSDPASITTYTKPLSIPTKPVKQSSTTSKITVQWSAPSSLPDHYVVTIYDSSDSLIDTAKIMASEAKVAEFSGLKAGEEYTVGVKTVVGDNIFSDEISDLFRLKPMEAQSVSVNSVTESTLSITWQAPDNSEYSAFKASIQGLDNSEREISASDLLQTGFTGLQAGKQYTVNIVTVSGTETSDPATATSYTKPNAAESVATRTVGTTSVEITWDDPASGSFNEFFVMIKPTNGAVKEEKAVAKETKSYIFDNLDAASQYTVSVQTRVGQELALISSNAADLQVTTLSTAPEGWTVVSITTTTMSFAWRAPSGITPDNYKVLIKKGEQTIVDETVSSLQYQRAQLSSGESYDIEIRPVVFSTEGEALTQTLTLDPLEVPQIGIPYKGQQTVEVEWDTPSSGTWTGFDIIVYNTNQDQVFREAVDAGSQKVDITGLQAGITYEIEIFTLSNNDATSEPKTSSFTTLPVGVSSIEVLERGENSISMEWEEPENTNLDRYELSITPNPANLNLPIVKTRGDTLQYRFEQLNPGHQYTITLVVSLSSGSQSSPSERTISTKPAAIINLLSGEITTSSIQLKWSVGVDTNQNNFQIAYTRTGQGNIETASVPAINSQIIYQTTLSSLAAGYTYTIRVRALTSDSVPGDETTVSFTTVPTAVTTVAAQASGPYDMNVNWVKDTSTFLTGFKVAFQGQDVDTNDKYEEVVADNLDRYSFTGLFPGERYKVSVYTMSGSQISEETSTFVTTVPLTVDQLQINEVQITTSTFVLTWSYDITRSRITEYIIKFSVSGINSFIERRISSVSSDYEVILSEGNEGKSFTTQVVAVSNDAQSDPVEVTVTLKPVMTSQLIEDTSATVTDAVSFTYTQSTGTFDRYIFTLNDKEITKTKADSDRKVTFSDLIPGNRYEILAITESGPQKSSPKMITITTRPNPPEVSLDQSETSIKVIISQSVGGVDRYDINCNTCGTYSIDVSGQNENTVEKLISNLAPHTEYIFDVIAYKSDKYSETVTKVARTIQGAPGVVQNLKTSDILPYKVTLTWSEPLEKNGVLTGYTISYVRSDENGEEVTLDESIQLVIRVTSYTFVDLLAGYTYTFEVRAKTVSAGAADYVELMMPIDEPELILPASEAKASSIKVSHDSFVIQIKNPFSERNGRIISYSLIVTTDPKDPTISSRASLNTYKQMKSSPLEKSYMAIHSCATLLSDVSQCPRSPSKRSLRIKRAVKQQELMIGAEDCDSVAEDVYCNGRLEPSTDYYVALRAYTGPNTFSDAPFSEAITTGKEVPALLIGLVVALLVLIILFVLVLVFVLYKRGYVCQKRNRAMYRKERPLSNSFDGRHSSHRKSKNVDSSRPVKLAEFAEYVRIMSADSDFKFSEEFEDLKQVGKEQSVNASELPVNRNKNRFTNILPYDHSRVKLLPTDDEEGSDYINSNYVPGYNSKREFIVCQGPLPSTRDDFWRMTWEQNCRAIVMLTKCVEKGREKCDHYWPVDSEPVFYGDLQVVILNETKCQEWVITEFKLSKGEQSRNIKHFHYIAWPDFGTPERPQSLISFVRLFRTKVGPEGGPVIIHCSAGVGRSGTMIALDNLLHRLEEGVDTVDIYNIVYEMRKHRVWMVQTEQQYICIHQCLLCIIEGKDKEGDPYDGQDNDAFEDDEKPKDESDEDEGITMEPN